VARSPKPSSVDATAALHRTALPPAVVQLVELEGIHSARREREICFKSIAAATPERLRYP
jgi:hypothetical protein